MANYKILFITLIVTLLVGCTTTKVDIQESLIGTNLEYANIAGDSMQYEITEKDITSIQQINDVWEVHIGHSLQWKLTLNDNREIIKTEQLFKT